MKNDHLGFTIPYVHKGRSHSYIPDFLVRLEPGDDGDRAHPHRRGLRQPEEPGPTRQKATTARDSWCVAVNNHGGFGRWGYIEMTDPLEFKSRLADAIQALYGDTADHRRPRPARLRAGRPWRVRSKPTGPTPVDSIKHDDKRTNIPTADAHDVRRPRDRGGPQGSLRPRREPRPAARLAREVPARRRDRRADLDLVTDAPPIYIQEKIDPRVLIENLRRTAESPRTSRS